MCGTCFAETLLHFRGETGYYSPGTTCDVAATPSGIISQLIELETQAINGFFEGQILLLLAFQVGDSFSRSVKIFVQRIDKMLGRVGRCLPL
jgi:hypothetical protein